MKRSILCLLFICLAFGLRASDSERIMRFHSDIGIDTTGRIVVKESITVYADGDDIQRGIVRVLPLVRQDKDGKNVKMNLKVLYILRDGHSEPYHTETTGNFLEVYMGSSDVFLKPGIYTYTVGYASFGHVGFFDDYDELYWNVTGNDWVFPIDEASATITLPDSASCINTSCYTGKAGSTASDCLSENSGNTVTFRTKGRLAPHEGLTVAVGFTRDIIKRPPPPTWLEIWWSTYKNIVCCLVIFFLLGYYYVVTWRKAGKDPAKPVVIPTFKPPHDWSPSAARYLLMRGYDEKAFTTAIVNLAVRGVIRITYESKEYTLEVVDSTKEMSHEERNMFNALFASQTSIKVSNKNHTTFSNAYSKLKSTLKTDWNIKDYYLNNFHYVFGAAMLCLIFSFAYLMIVHSMVTFAGLIFTLFIMILGAFAVFSAVKQKNFFNLVIFSFGILMILFGFVNELFELFLSDSFAAGFFALMIVSFGLYVYLIQAPTVLGAKTKSELEGFKMYLKTAEENRLNLLTPPERTPELYEKMLPYALALDVENEWGKKFDNVLKQANYNPEWYDGGQTFRPDTFTNTLGNTFYSSLNRARIDPAASSSRSSGSSRWGGGSSGGGFSGGGGGGGGGRGW